MRKSIKRCLTVALSVLVCSLSCVPAAAEVKNFVIDTDNNMLPIPETYTVTNVIKNLDGTDIAFKNAEDLFVDSEDNIYVADTGNNRVLKLNSQGKVLLEIKTAFLKNLNSPRGVFVDSDLNIWIADTGNQRLVVVTKDAKDYIEYKKPSGITDSKGATFDIEKVVVNDMGYIFALKGAYVMKMDMSNTFQGYMGAKNVDFSFSRFLIRTFGSEAQTRATEALRPTSYNNLTIASDGNLYGVLSEGTSGQIRRLNSVGTNTYPESSYGFMGYYKEGAILPTEPTFHDIAVDNQGIVSVVDQNTGLIYQYDKEGNLLTTFGGKGDKKGTFKSPCSIAVDSNNRLYVLDYSETAACIQVFSETNFITLVHEAINLQLDGEYTKAQDMWEDILKIDSSYFVAHKSIGKIQYKQGKYTESMASYKMAEDKSGYSEAFSEARHEVFRHYFFWIVVVIVAIIVVFIKTFTAIKKRADKWAFDIEMKGDM